MSVKVKFFLSAVVLGVFVLFMSPFSFAHCQLPCGIYGDEMRFDMIDEHLTTIEKSMKEIERLSAEGEKNYNQIVRWVMNKEDHTAQLDEIITYYFMAQRIKPVDKSDAKGYSEYLSRLELLHQMLVYSMKCKQTTDTANVEKLRELTGKFYKAYFGEDHVRHEHK